MRQVFLDKGTAVVKEVSRPYLDDYSVLVSVHYSFVSSGTEIATITNAKASLFTNVPHKVKRVLESVSAHGIESTTALIKGKLKGDIACLGYSCAGHIIAVGSKVRNLRPGDLVACAGAGYAHHADLVCVPEHLTVKVSKKEHIRAASITTIGAIALQGIRRASLQLGESVCVIGLGLLGQLTIQLAKLSGCTVFGIDIIDDRLQLAKALGADAVYHATHDNVIHEVNLATQRFGVDATIITAASKSDAIVQQAMEITRKKGRVIIVGDVGLGLQRDPLYKKEIDVLISCSYGPGRYDSDYEEQGHDYPYAHVRWTENRNMQAFVQLIEQGAIKIDPLISEQVTLDAIEHIYEHIQKKELLGVILSYGPKEEKKDIDYLAQQDDQKEIKQDIRFVPATKNAIRVGMVGAGGFAKIKLLPIVSKIKGVTINAVVDTDIANSLSISRLYGAATAYAHDDDLFKNDLVDVVVIASPHKYHCAQALNALQNGKAVFTEKPMVTDFDQLEQMKTFLHTHPGAPFCVDYNRTFAPLIKKIKPTVQKRNTPLMIQYRMNAGFIPKEHWIQTEIGAGRIIGEACHIFDLFCYLTESEPVAVSVEALYTTREDLFPTDNFNAQISFKDGSVCSLMYTALGHAKLGKERMEIFFDSKTIVMEDYIKLTGFGLSSRFDDEIITQDKGHETLINTFFQSIKKNQFAPPIDFTRLLMVAELTLIIDQLVCEGGGSKTLDGTKNI